MSIEIVVAIIGIIGGVVGGLVSGGVQYLATTRHERWKHATEARTSAYNAYINAVSRLAIYNGSTGNKPPSAMGEEELKVFLPIQMDFHDAKNRVALYGSRRVLGKLATFSNKHARMADDSDFEAYIDVIEAMRDDAQATNYEGFRRDVDNFMLRGELKHESMRRAP